MMTSAQFLAELRALISDIKKELANRESGQPGVGTGEELTYIWDELVGVEARIASGSIPLPKHRYLASTRIVSDTWPFNSTLGEHARIGNPFAGRPNKWPPGLLYPWSSCQFQNQLGRRHV